MPRMGLLIDYEYCTGCHTCEVACKQEHNHPAGEWGIKVNENIVVRSQKVTIDYIPFPTQCCDLCRHRTSQGLLPACVKHCQADCMRYGTIAELSKVMENKPRTVLFAPR